jgi:hypothetical protein
VQAASDKGKPHVEAFAAREHAAIGFGARDLERLNAASSSDAVARKPIFGQPACRLKRRQRQGRSAGGRATEAPLA